MSGFVCIWFDRKHKRYYVGSHWGAEDDGYICSSKWMLASYDRRPNDFKRRILKRITTNRIDLYVEENRWLSMMKDEELRHRYYNLRKVAGHWSANPDYDILTIREKISVKTKERMDDPEVRARFLKAMENHPGPGQDHMKKLHESNRGRKNTEETRLKMSEAAKRRGISGETRAKMIAGRAVKNPPPPPKKTVAEHASYISSTKWYNDGEKNVRSPIHPGDGWVAGKIQKKDPQMWWNDGVKNFRGPQSPGPGWVQGMLKRAA